MFRTLDDLPDDGRVLVRIDVNSPLEDGEVQDSGRFERHARTLAELADAGHRVGALAHQGRPGRDTFGDLEGHSGILSSYLDRDVRYVPDTYGEGTLEP